MLLVLRSDSDGDGDDDARAYRRGDRVEARYRGKSRWYPAVITGWPGEGPEDTYDIRYDDGEKEFGVRAEFIRPQESDGRDRGPARGERKPHEDEGDDDDAESRDDDADGGGGGGAEGKKKRPPPRIRPDRLQSIVVSVDRRACALTAYIDGEPAGAWTAPVLHPADVQWSHRIYLGGGGRAEENGGVGLSRAVVTNTTASAAMAKELHLHLLLSHPTALRAAAAIQRVHRGGVVRRRVREERRRAEAEAVEEKALN
uniref:Tudor domain-containing protein n=1 Tax=Phaeomonas parva TaxID=124430 RepID=A0A7S1TRR9_9STRA|mmetsp:Transcript_14782/g.44511  ORF Transcript_14782/g.44511 Transcript_14782/m.44511 type:complete len:257 (+) Transcript_14782:127-897(+)